MTPVPHHHPATLNTTDRHADPMTDKPLYVFHPGNGIPIHWDTDGTPDAWIYPGPPPAELLREGLAQ